DLPRHHLEPGEFGDEQHPRRARGKPRQQLVEQRQQRLQLQRLLRLELLGLLRGRRLHRRRGGWRRGRRRRGGRGWWGRRVHRRPWHRRHRSLGITSPLIFEAKGEARSDLRWAGASDPAWWLSRPNRPAWV